MPELRNKNILVTGGAGFIGSHIVDTLAEERPSKIVVIDNMFLGRRTNLDNALNRYRSLIIIEEDASDYEAMKSIVKKYRIEIIFNLAVIPLPTSLDKPKWSVDKNITITTTLCELAKEKQYKTLIHFSSSEAYGSAVNVPMSETHIIAPTTPYAASKAADDHIVISYIETFNIDAAIIRPFNNYGPRQNDKAYAGIIPIIIKRVFDKEKIIIFGDGEQTRDFIYVKDTAEAAVAVYKCNATRGNITNVASGNEVSINHLVETLFKILNVGNYPIIHVEPRPGDVRRHCASIEKAKQLISFNPKINLIEGLKKTVAWYSDKYADVI